MKKVLSIIVSLMLIVSPVYALDSEGVIYDNSTSGSSATNVNDALNDLYSKLDTIKNIGNATSDKILSGYTAYVKGNTITGSIPSKGATTYTPGTSNQTIASGQYLSGVQTMKGDSNLVAANIAKGKSIFGISGTYTSDANAVAGNILSGKTAYVNGSKITGTISSKGAATYTPGKSNQTIASGQYLSGVQTIKGDANLVAGNIAKGKSIFGISGTYTSDANAVAGNILSGKTAYVNGSKITGTISSKGAATYTPGKSNQTIASGQYLSGTQTIKGDSNLVASNIANGKTIFGVTGTYTGGTITSTEKLGNTTNVRTIPSGCSIYIFIGVNKITFSNSTALYSDRIGSGGTLTWYASVFDSKIAGQTASVGNLNILCLK
ncbi:MAG: hypothetical protein OSJ65_04155 [Bacilli bacterium]|nr:hypothetical protein [Bacilli bacterium]